MSLQSQLSEFRRSWSLLVEAYRFDDDRVLLTELYCLFLADKRACARDDGPAVRPWLSADVRWTQQLEDEIAAHTNQEEETP